MTCCGGLAGIRFETVPLKRVLKSNDGGAWGADSEAPGTTPVPVLRSTDQSADGNWALESPAIRFLSAVEARATRLIEGDLVVTKSSGSERHIGKTTIVDSGLASLSPGFSNFMQRLRPNPMVTFPRFAWYFLNSRVAREQMILASSTSTGLANLNAQVIGDLLIPLPSTEEQCRIAAFLDHETARIDELVREQERLQSLLAEKRDEVIGRAVREGLDGEESIPIGDVFIRSAPKSWQVSPLRRFLKHVSPRAVGEAWRDYTLLSLTRQGIIERDIDSGIGKFPAEFNGYQRVEPGQVVFCLFDIDETPRTVGYSDKRGMITSAYAVFEPTEYGNGEFISYYFQYVDTYKGLRPFYSGLRKTIRPNNFLGVRVAIPEVSEQERIVRFLDAELEKLDRLAEVAQRNIDLLLERRSALISAAVTGHLDLRDWQPSAPERVAEVA